MREALPGCGGLTSGLERELRDMNAALLVSSIHHQELAEQAQRAEAALRRSEAALRAHGEELERFNRIAVGRELRMMELKREVNDLAQRCGEQARYVAERGDEDTTSHVDPVRCAAEQHGPAGALFGDRAVQSASVPLTDALGRGRRAPDYRSESLALAALVQSLVKSAGGILQALAEKICEVLKADSAGISLRTQDDKRFYWSAIAGAWQPHVGDGTPREFGPCADVFGSNTPLLFTRLERRCEYLWPVTPPIEQGLMVPFYVEGKRVGALWAVSHGDRIFDAEDLRQLESLGRFGSAAYLEQSRRIAARNLMEDAVMARRAMEEIIGALRASEGRYRTLFTSIDEGFCVIEMLSDAEGGYVDYRFLETNPAFEQQAGLRGAAGKRIRELVPNHEAHWFESFGNVAKTGEPMRFSNEARGLGGRWFDVYAFRLGDADGHRVAVLFTDISERKRLEEATRQQAKSLVELNRRKDEFLAMLSHELRNPLAAILNTTQLLRMQRDRSLVQIEAQGLIERQIGQLVRLVDDLLEVSRISTGRIRMCMERVDLRIIVERAVETTRSLVDTKAQSLAASVPDEPLWVSGDCVRLEQVVVNLLNNAIKYTDRGGEIRVTLARQADEGVLRIRDNGVGIAPEMLPHIFDLFIQADRSLDRAQGGLGIGLTLVQSLVTMHQGLVEVWSTLDEGSEFVVRLPLLLSPQLAGVNVVAAVPVLPQARKVLVVDDNLDAAQSAAMLLQALGHDARMAHDGVSAVSVAREFEPDVMLLDIGLPVVDGLQVAKRIREEPSLRHVVLVALTGYGQQSDRQRAQEAGFDHYLVKPVDFARVQSILSAPAGAR